MSQVIGSLKRGLQRASNPSERREGGQALIIVIIGIFGLLALVGLAVDLGIYYVERVRITRAVDGATLAAAYELPMEMTAHAQAEDFLLQNGYDPYGPNTALIVDGGEGPQSHGPSSGITRTIIAVDTAMFQDPPGAPNSAYRIRVQITQTVPVIFLRFAGFGDDITCYASATAENINNLDVVLVFDRSGSMEFDTLCYGCWELDAGVPYSSTQPCRDGICHPLPWNGPANGLPEHCQATHPYSYNGYDYYFIEAEEYSYMTNIKYERDLYTIGYTYWILQRASARSTNYASGRDSRRGYIMHMPYPDMEESSSSGVTCRYDEVVADGKCWSGAPGGPYDAPRVDYNFSVDTGDYYIWVRGQSMRGDWGWDRDDRLDERLFWAIDGVMGGGGHGDCGNGCEAYFNAGTGYNGADAQGSNRWQWRRLNSGGIPFHWNAGEEHTLSIWAAGAGFAMDRIVITTNPYGSDGSPPSGPMQWNSQRGAEVWADGRSGWACDPCDARFAGYPADHPDRPAGFDPSDVVSYFPVCDRGETPDRRTDGIYDDEQPIRAAVEAAKMFVSDLLDPAYDQIGYVRYSTSSEIASELQCLRRLGSDACDEEEINDTVIAALDATHASGNTNIAGGMLNGLEVLSTQSPHYGRPGATHVMIVMTDGRANEVPNSYCDDDPDRQWPGGTAAQDCVIYYAYEARDNNVIVYTITLGVSADFELMEEVARLTGGVHRNADRPEKLPAIFEELYELMFLRLVE